MVAAMMIKPLRPRRAARAVGGANGSRGMRLPQECVIPAMLRRSFLAMAEREVRELTREIAEAESRTGMLRRQRENLLKWLFRQGKDAPPRGVMPHDSPL